MASSFLLYSDLTTRTVKTKAGGTNFIFPAFTGGEAVSLALRFTETKVGATVETFPQIAGMRAAIGRSDAAPTAGSFKLNLAGATTTAIAWNASAADLQSALNAILTGGTTCRVVQDGPAYVITFSDGALHTIVPAANDLDPISLVRIRTQTLGDTVEHELTLVQAPVAATNVWNPIVPPAPSVVKIQSGSTDSSGQFKYPTIENLTIPASFRGTYRLTFGNAKTTALSVGDGTAQIAAALNALWSGEFQTVSVTNPQTSVAMISFDGLGFLGSDQPLLGVEVISAPPGDNTLLLDLNTSECFQLLRGADTVSDLFLEVEADILTPGTDYHQTVTLFRQKVSLQRPINWPGLEAATQINWAVPPGPTSYIPFDPSQIITGQQFYTTAVGDGTATSYTITHNLGTANLHLTLRDNASGSLLVNGVNYHAVVATDTVTLAFATAPAPGAVVAVISTAGPTSAFVSDIHIDIAQVSGLATTVSNLQSTVSQIQAILPNHTSLGVVNATQTAPFVTIPLSKPSSIIGYTGGASFGTDGYSEKDLPHRAAALLTDGSYDRELWRIPLHAQMFGLGRTLQVDWGVALQALRANCQVQYTLVVETGTYTSHAGNLSAVAWNTGAPVFSVPIALAAENIVHSFGLTLLNNASGIVCNQQLYGVMTSNNGAFAGLTGDLALRCRLINLDPEDIGDPRGWIALGLVPSVTASQPSFLGGAPASTAQASIY